MGLNIVDGKKQGIEKLAKNAGLNIYFRQTNGPGFSCYSRIYLTITGIKNVNYSSDGVLVCWGFPQSQTSGKSKKCERYRILIEVE